MLATIEWLQVIEAVTKISAFIATVVAWLWAINRWVIKREGQSISLSDQVKTLTERMNRAGAEGSTLQGKWNTFIGDTELGMREQQKDLERLGREQGRLEDRVTSLERQRHIRN